MISWCLKYNHSNYEEVVRHLFLAIGISPNCQDAWAHLAQEMIEIKNYPMALAAANNALHLDSKNAYLIEENIHDRMKVIMNESYNYIHSEKERIE